MKVMDVRIDDVAIPLLPSNRLFVECCAHPGCTFKVHVVDDTGTRLVGQKHDFAHVKAHKAICAHAVAAHWDWLVNRGDA